MDKIKDVFIYLKEETKKNLAKAAIDMNVSLKRLILKILEEEINK